MSKELRLTRGQAIRLFCLECQGWTGRRDGANSPVSIREASKGVEQCGDPHCFLYPHRKSQLYGGLKALFESLAIREEKRA